ncbi:MAG: adenylosuccinate lyase [bacterium]|nr:adenylosuccinate lyase [bacterium]
MQFLIIAVIISSVLSDDSLQNISSIDGRYKDKTQKLTNYFSEFALIKKRIFVEIEYLKLLSVKKVAPKLNTSDLNKLSNIYINFDVNEAKKVKKIEREINHDVKAVEIYLGNKFKQLKLQKLIPFIHIGLTSSDTNNIAQSLLIKGFTNEVFLPILNKITLKLKKLSNKYKSSVLLARTHGQPAVPTTFGKELINFLARLKKQENKVKNFTFEAKINGAVGNYNALNYVFPKGNWIDFSLQFLRKLDLKTNLYTTQILPYDNLIEFFQIILVINGILIDLSSDIWIYSMQGLIVFDKSTKQVGSSTMPQKINPIEFENAEGNLSFANSNIAFYQQKLLISRLQRDLTDSTVSRTFGSTLAHCIIGWENIIKGLEYLKFNENEALIELDKHWEVLSESIQTYLRSKGDLNSFDKIKKLFYGKKLTKQEYLKIVSIIKDKKMLNLEPKNYLGLSQKLVEKYK